VRYRYTAFNKAGSQIAGTLEAPDEQAAERLLWGQGLTIAELAKTRSARNLRELFPTFFGVKRQDLIVFSRQLSTLLDSGIAVVPALRLLGEQATQQALSEIIAELVASVQEGTTLSASIEAHPLAFPQLYARTIAVGERTGNLEVVLDQLADYMEKQQTLTHKLRDAMVYPVFVVVVAFFVIILMFTVALPPIIDLFSSFDAELPWPTRLMIGISTFLTSYGGYIAAGGLSLAALAGWWNTRPGGRRLRDQLLLRVPLVGRVILLGQVTRFTTTTSMLIGAGLPLSEIMDLAIQTSTNIVISEALERVKTELLGGRGLAAPLSEESIFPPLLGQMARVGEESGTLEKNLATLSIFYEDETERKTQAMVAAVEPILTIIVGALVAFIAISMVLPMYSVLSEIG
jgi:type IV pilus assembly protein PilC